MSDEALIAQRLRDAGYSTVQMEPRVPGLSSVRPDVLAWASDADGVLVPWAVVEVKRGPAARPEVALGQLATVRDQLGTIDHYAVVNGEWFRADRSLRRVEPVLGPQRPPYGSRGSVKDVPLATALVSERLWGDARRRGHAEADDRLELFMDAVRELRNGLLVTRPGEKIPADNEVLWRAGRRALTSFAARDMKAGPHLSHPVIARAVAQLAGDHLSGLVLDPFCGAGEFLWAAVDRAEELGRRVSLMGRDISEQMVEIAFALASVAPVSTQIDRGDAYTSDFPRVGLVLTAPPLRPRLDSPAQLQDGIQTRDGEVAAIDVAVRTLLPGGRAVLQISAGPTFRPDAEHYRRYLAERYRVGALIGCPSGSIPGTGRGAVLMVIDKSSPTETFVAQLGEDWEQQLSSDGTAMRAALAHLDGEVSPVQL
jgi:SAM-dependent methyltransferase